MIPATVLFLSETSPTRTKRSVPHIWSESVSDRSPRNGMHHRIRIFHGTGCDGGGVTGIAQPVLIRIVHMDRNSTFSTHDPSYVESPSYQSWEKKRDQPRFFSIMHNEWGKLTTHIRLDGARIILQRTRHDKQSTQTRTSKINGCKECHE